MTSRSTYIRAKQICDFVDALYEQGNQSKSVANICRLIQKKYGVSERTYYRYRKIMKESK